ncbi:hypothetical protein CIB48_g4240 [Xylaria polymorpha]|nr:hypothetical protein CIB48_g4240 [Xylaria polymorpha]
MASQGEALDLVDIAVLLNYEKCIASPLFRHTKLREVCRPGQELRTVMLVGKPWTEDSRTRTAVVLERGDGETDKEVDRTLMRLGHPTQDPPMLMLPPTITPDLLNGIGTKELETLYYQIQAHNGCFTSVALLQHFFDLFPANTPIRIRHGPQRGALPPNASFIATIERRRILETTLLRPKHANLIIVLPESIAHVNGEGVTMAHAVMGFLRESRDEVNSILDLSSLQFGEVGRGPGSRGQALFALDTMDEFLDRMEKVAEDRIREKSRMSLRIDPCPHDEWLKEVARKVKDR